MNLNELYFDPKFPGAYGGVEKFYYEVKKKHPNVTRVEIRKFLTKQDAYTLHKIVRKPKLYRRVIVKGIEELYQADLVDFQKYTDENDGYRYVCFVIDTFSKKLWVFKLKNKTGLSLKKALQMFLLVNRPKKMQVDQGTEFFNSIFARMMEAFGIKLYHTYSDKKASIVERVQRTIREKLGKLFTKNNNHRWVDHLQDVVDNYNHSYHRSIKMRPADVELKHTHHILKALYPKRKYVMRRYKVGDRVRIVKLRKRFQKGSEQLWTKEIFIVDEIRVTKPTTYILKDSTGEVISGGFYFEELQKV